MERFEQRRQKLLNIRDRAFGGSNAALARKIGKSDSYVARMLYSDDKKGRKRIGEDTASAIDAAFDWPPGSFDHGAIDDLISDLLEELRREEGAPPQATSPKSGETPNDPANSVQPATSASSQKSAPRHTRIDVAHQVDITTLIPVLGVAQLVDNGDWANLEHPVDTGDGYVDFITPDHDAYALLCEGDSMLPRIQAGEFVVVEPNQPVEPGDDVLLKSKDGRFMIKRFLYRRTGRTHLISVNNLRAPMALADNEIDKMHFVRAICRPSPKRPE